MDSEDDIDEYSDEEKSNVSSDDKQDDDEEYDSGDSNRKRKAKEWKPRADGKKEKKRKGSVNDDETDSNNQSCHAEYMVYKTLYEQEKKEKEEHLIQLGQLRERLDHIAEKYRESKYVGFARTYIENIEDEFTKYEISHRTPFQYDYSFINRLNYYFDRGEEMRRQRWVYYMTSPPSLQVMKFVSRMAAHNFKIQEVSEAVARIYKTISSMYHLGYFKGLGDDWVKVKSSLTVQFGSNVCRILDVILEEADLSE